MKWLDVLRYARYGSPEPDRRVIKTDAEWQQQLSPEQYRITRKKGTEAPYSGALCNIFDTGVYTCVCCDTPLFDSRIKFDSQSGWPSFTAPIRDNVIKYERDRSRGMYRMEARCNVCDGHLGHVFPDGPPPAGLRYCINSAAIQLKKNESK